MVFRIFRSFFRRRFGRMEPEKALKIKERISIVYMIIGWNILGVVAYMSYKGRSDWPSYYGLKTEEQLTKKPALYFAETLGIKKAHIITYKGFTRVSEMDYEEGSDPVELTAEKNVESKDC